MYLENRHYSAVFTKHKNLLTKSGTQKGTKVGNSPLAGQDTFVNGSKYRKTSKIFMHTSTFSERISCHSLSKYIDKGRKY